jgi:hypothetical protein
VSCGTWGRPRETIEFRLQGCYLLWRAFPDPSTTRLLCNSLRAPQRPPRPPATPNVQRLRACIRPVWANPLSLATTRGIAICFLFLRLLRWFSSPRWPLAAYEFSGGCAGITPRRFPDSEIPGSMPVSDSPGLFAAVHVLLRLPAPRHPPCALSSLTVSLRRTPNNRDRSSMTEPLAVWLSWCVTLAFPLGCLRFSFQRTMSRTLWS